jgi:4-amino-4-deoxy-L-arabinose transferase-like glycosyltransferase
LRTPPHRWLVGDGFRLTLVLLLLLALACRCVVVGTTPDFDPSTAADPADYQRHALSISRGDGYPESLVAGGGPTASRPPLYTYWLGGVFKLSGERVSTARYAQAVIGTLTVALLGLLAWQIWGRRVALIAVALAAVFPPLIVVGASLLTEPLYLPLELAALAAVIQHRRSRHRYRWVVAGGVLAGLMILTRETGAVLLVAFAAGVWTGTPRLSRRALAPPVLLLVVAALTVLPWTLRNAIVMDSFIPVSTTGSFALSGIYNDAAREARAAFRVPQLDPRYAPIVRRTDLEEAEVARKLRGEVVDYVGDHPTYVPEAGFWNTLRMLHLYDPSYARVNARDNALGRGLANLGLYGFYPVALLAALGAFTRRARECPRFLWLAPLLLASVVFGGSFIRYRAPIDPFLILLAALAVASALDRLGERARRSRRALSEARAA